MVGRKELLMSALVKSMLLFSLNWLDAQLTIIWVRSNLATDLGRTSPTSASSFSTRVTLAFS